MQSPPPSPPPAVPEDAGRIEKRITSRRGGVTESVTFDIDQGSCGEAFLSVRVRQTDFAGPNKFVDHMGINGVEQTSCNPGKSDCTMFDCLVQQKVTGSLPLTVSLRASKGVERNCNAFALEAQVCRHWIVPCRVVLDCIRSPG